MIDHTTQPIPELLAPVGDLERLKMALHFGADAVYLALERYGMRAFAGNFTPDGLRWAVRLAHAAGAKVHVTCNTLPREDELRDLPAALELIQDAGADAVIAADFGVMQLVKRYAPRVALHVSTQFGVVNSASACALHDLGAARVVLARELHLDEIAAIRANTPAALELEAFVHGAMCVSFSGRCLISNYMTGRDANRGECAQPCRWEYGLVEKKRPGEVYDVVEDGGTFLFNSRDMCMIEHLREVLQAGVTSLKVEGRMKSAYYVGAVTNAYRHALDAALRGETPDPVWVRETEQISHRPYSTGFYFGEPGQYTSESAYFSGAMFCAVVDGTLDGRPLLSQRNKLTRGDVLELVTPEHPPVTFVAEDIRDVDGTPLETVPQPMRPFTMPLPIEAAPLALIRRKMPG
ncbi:MAG: U32 family peptidase [Oscillospiraceae bacterium]|nr:U32 family peptidase [Oscillospiraceae bacterium]